MKQRIRFFSISLIVLCFLLHCSRLLAQPYIIPWATQQPAWVFPLFLEAGDGQQDTLYFCYDPTANDIGIGGHDTIFGETWIKIDTSKFNAAFGGVGNTDSVLKVIVSPLLPSAQFGYDNGIWPLIIQWDDSLFYSDTLPVADLFPAPNVRGELSCAGDFTGDTMCPLNFPVTLSDTFAVFMYPVHATDSIIFQPTWTMLESYSFALSIVPWNMPLIPGVLEQNSMDEFRISPNPAKEHMTIRTRGSSPYWCTIVNMLGAIIYRSDLLTGEIAEISLETMSRGVYFIQITSKTSSITIKFIKGG